MSLPPNIQCDTGGIVININIIVTKDFDLSKLSDELRKIIKIKQEQEEHDHRTMDQQT